MHIDRKLRIAIDCRIENSQQGVGTAVLALAKALSDSKIEDQEYTFIVREDMQDWLASYIYGPCKLVGIPVSKFSRIRPFLRWITPLRFIWKKARGTVISVPISDGYLESQQFDLVHFPTQIGFLTKIPSIYQPWDLQHLHYPQFFSRSEILFREKCYRAYCQRATYVCVQAEWSKRDIVKHYGLSEDKVAVIPWGSVFNAYKTPSREMRELTSEKYHLPQQFFIYPAVTWPHKNHEVIIRALHILKREHNRKPTVYFTGSPTVFRAQLELIAKELAVSEQIHFLGFLPNQELQAIFNTATAMIFPSKFEGFGLPILEAFDAHLPVLSSNATTLPEVAKDAALYFDPDSPSELAALMKATLDTPALRQDLIRKGSLVLSHHSISKTAAGFQALYEKTAALYSQKQRPSQVSAAT